jgi:hypothetical protein
MHWKEIETGKLARFSTVNFSIFAHSVFRRENVKMLFGEALEKIIKNIENVGKLPRI